MPFPLSILLFPDDQILSLIKDLTTLTLQCILSDLDGGIALNVQFDGLKRSCLEPHVKNSLPETLKSSSAFDDATVGW